MHTDFESKKVGGFEKKGFHFTPTAGRNSKYDRSQRPPGFISDVTYSFL